MVALLLGACAGTPTVDERPTIVATTTILGDVVSNVVGDAFNVEVLMPVGADPHDFRPSAKQIAVARDATLVVANGLDLEQGLTEVLEGLERDGVPVFRVGEVIEPRRFDDGRPDPHVWFDPVRMAEAVERLGDELDRLDPSQDWVARSEAYAGEILQTEAAMRDIFSAIPPERRKLVASHLALGYLADRFGFEMIGVIVPGGSTLGEPSAAHLAELAAVIVEQDVPAIFVETTVSPKLAEALAAETGRAIAVVPLYTGSLGEPGSGAETYLGMLLTDAQRIADALR
jgi:zinc/manganese transport system substrate-binding protein